VLQRTVHSNGVVVYHSPLLRKINVVHAFSARIGGISRGDNAMFESLNFGNPGEGIRDHQRDPQENFDDNFRRLQAAIGCPGIPRAWVRQVHGRRVELLEREPESEYAETLEAEVRDRWSGQMSADGMVAAVPNVLLTVRVADCVPILLSSGDGKIVAAVHAGWRGVVGDIAGRAIRVMEEAGAKPRDIIAAIGPGISADHFEVGEEVAKAFEEQALGVAVIPADAEQPKPHIDLQAAIRKLLERAGITHIDGNELCTYRDKEEFFSHRREKGLTGRMVGAIAAKSAT
jgi:YfiH family protein